MSDPSRSEPPVPARRSGQLLALDEARVQYAAVRSTVDAFNVRVGWLFGYLGVLVLASATIITQADSTSSRVAGMVAAALIAMTVALMHRVAIPVSLTGIQDRDWITNAARGSEDEDATAAALTRSIMKAVADDTGADGVVATQSRRLRWLFAGVLVSTGAVLVSLFVAAWPQ